MKRKLKIIAITVFTILIVVIPVYAGAVSYKGGTYLADYVIEGNPPYAYSYYMHPTFCNFASVTVNTASAYDIKPGGSAAYASVTIPNNTDYNLYYPNADTIPDLPRAECN